MYRRLEKHVTFVGAQVPVHKITLSQSKEQSRQAL